MLRLKADDEDGVSWIRGSDLEVMDDAPGFRHTGGRDDHHWAHGGVQRLRFLRLTSVVRLLKAEECLDALHEILGAVEYLRMRLEDGRRLDGERTVDVDRNRWNLAGQREGVQVVHDLLGTTHGECRDEYPSAARSRLANDPRQITTRRCVRRMIPIAVRRLHDDDVGSLRRLGISNDREPAASNVSRKHEPLAASALIDVQDDRRGSE